MLVEKRIAGIIKWLERLNKSYSSGKIESALMDAECARADLENLRQDVWAQVRTSGSSQGSLLGGVLSISRIVFLAVIIVMVHVVPLSREVSAPVHEELPSVQIQSRPIIVIHEYGSPKPETQTAVIPQRKQSTPKRTASRRSQPAQQTPAPSQPAKTQAEVKTVPYDKVYSLIQTGQRALKNNSSVIKIQ